MFLARMGCPDGDCPAESPPTPNWTICVRIQSHIWPMAFSAESAIWERGGALKPFRWLGPPGVLPLAASARVIGLDGGASAAGRAGVRVILYASRPLPVSGSGISAESVILSLRRAR